METKIFEIGSKDSRLVELNPLIWECKFSPHLISLYNRYTSFNKRRVLSKTKTKGEVSGGGRKPWRQKGTGRARQGSIRSPQWKGGGVVFGPTGEQNYKIDLNKKVRKQALSSLLSKKLSEKELLITNQIPILTYSTKQAISFLDNLDLKNRKALIVLSNFEITNEIKKSFSNLSNICLINSGQMNILNLISCQSVILTEKSLREIEERLL